MAAIVFGRRLIKDGVYVEQIISKFDNDTFNPAAIPPLVILAVLVSTVIILCLPHRRNTSADRNPKTFAALRALQAAIVPANSQWPKRWWSLVAQASSTRNRSLQIPLNDLLSGLFAGELELRDPMLTLPCLLRDGLVVDGWRITIAVEFTSWMDIMSRVVFLHCFPVRHRVSDAHPNCVRS